MISREQISMTQQMAAAATEKERSSRTRNAWLAGLALSGAAGIACGGAGLLLSFLAAEGIVSTTSGVRLLVPMLIVGSLSLLMCSAHCMDRLHQIRLGK